MSGTARTDRSRWTILALLTCFSLVSYVERVNLTVSARFIRDEFGLSNAQIGWAFSSFLIAYALGQVPVGLVIDRFGARMVLAIAGTMWFGVTLLLGIIVGHVASTAWQVVATLILSRVALGFLEAPTYPAAAFVISHWYGPSERGVPNAIIQGAAYLGEAVTLIVMGSLTAYLGWRSALLSSAMPPLLITVAWWQLGADRPNISLLPLKSGEVYAQHEQSNYISRSMAFINKDLMLTSVGYFFHLYVTYLFFFWFYIYLVDVRHLAVADGGLVGAVPTIAAALCASAGGPISDLLARRYGHIRGRRWLIFAAGIVGAASLCMGAFSSNIYIAVAGFTLTVGMCGVVDGSFWSIITDVGANRPGFSAGVMNFMGNVGGAISTASAPLIVPAFGWPIAMMIAALSMAASGLVMFGLGNGSGQPLELVRQTGA